MAGISPSDTVLIVTQLLYRPDRDVDRLALQALLSLPGDVDVLGPIFARLRADHSTISVLDVGCATGVAALQRFSAPDITLTGIDLSEEAVALANASVPGFAGSATFLAGDVADLTGTYDVVFCALVTHLLPDPSVFLARLYARVAPGGCLVVRALDDALKVVWPETPASRRIDALTPRAFSGVNRFGGRAVPVYLQRLPGATVTVHPSLISTLTLEGPEGRRAYFEIVQGWKTDVITRPSSDLTELRLAVDAERVRFYSDSELFSLCYQIIAVATKPVL